MTHECKYWQNNIKWNYRRCGFCGRIQYNYGGEWKDQIRSLGFLEEWMSQGSTDYSPQIEIDVGFPFEYGGHYETWSTFFRVKIGDKWFGPFDNFNQAQYMLRKELNQNNK